jgi:predicted nucleotidyltransferase
MIDLQPRELELVLNILKTHLPHCEVRAFGSRVTRRGVKKYSDLDLAVVGKGKLAPGIIQSLSEAFQDSDLPFRVDVLDWNSLSQEFQNAIEKESVVLQLLAK